MTATSGQNAAHGQPAACRPTSVASTVADPRRPALMAEITVQLDEHSLVLVGRHRGALRTTGCAGVPDARPRGRPWAPSTSRRYRTSIALSAPSADVAQHRRRNRPRRRCLARPRGAEAKPPRSSVHAGTPAPERRRRRRRIHRSARSRTVSSTSSARATAAGRPARRHVVDLRTAHRREARRSRDDAGSRISTGRRFPTDQTRRRSPRSRSDQAASGPQNEVGGQRPVHQSSRPGVVR